MSASDLARELDALRTLSADLSDDSPSTDLMRASVAKRTAQVETDYEAAITPVLQVQMRGKPVRGHEVFVAAMTRLVHELQESVSSIGQAMRGVATERAPIPGVIRDETAFRLAALTPGSVVLQLRGPADERVLNPGLFDSADEGELEDTLVSSAVKTLMDLLASAGNDTYEDSDIIETVLALGPRTFRHVDQLAKVVVDEEFDVDLGWTLPIGETRSEPLTRQRSRRLRDVLGRTQQATETLELRGQLGGASMFRGAFELRTLEGQTVRGRVAEGLVPRLPTWFGRWVVATVEQSTTREPGAGRERTHNTLVGLAADAEFDNREVPPLIAAEDPPTS